MVNFISTFALYISQCRSAGRLLASPIDCAYWIDPGPAPRGDCRSGARAACVGCIRNMASSSSSSSLYTLTQTRRHGVSHTFPLSLSFCILATRVSVHCSHIFTARTRFTSRVIVRFSPGPPLRRLGAFRSMAVIYSDHLSERRADWQLINTSSRGGISIGDFVSDKMGASAPVIAV